MDPAFPDWHAFGQPAPASPSGPDRDTGRVPAAPGIVDRVPRSTLLLLVLAAFVTVAGIAMAVASLPGGSIDLGVADGGGAAPGGDTAAPARAGVAAAARDPAGGSLLEGSTSAVGRSSAPQQLIVDVAGAVVRPGLVRLPAGSRVGDAVGAAGGFGVRADLGATSSTLNLAALLQDGDKVLVPALGQDADVPDAARAGAPSGVAVPDTGSLIDLNAASASELESLPGIGPVTAGRIIDARAQARFTSVDELRSRGLVGESTFAKLRALVTVGP